jgi:DNA-binding LacI/PurR family transcriptional regulator
MDTKIENLENDAHTPKYEQVAREVRDQIRVALLKPGDRLPSYEEMRSRGISQSTVGRAFVLLQQEGLIERKHGRGIFVAHPPRNKTGVIGLYGISPLHPYYAALVSGLQQVLHPQGQELLLLNEEPNLGLDRLDGLIFYPHPSLENLPELPMTMPQVKLMECVSGVNCVGATENQGVVDSINHLRTLGHSKIAYLTQYGGEKATGRQQAYLNRLSDENLTPLVKIGCEVERMPGGELEPINWGYVTMQDWLETDWDSSCTAILVQNDDSAFGVLAALREAGLKVPEDVSVIGFDDTPRSAFCFPPLTTINMPLTAIGNRAAEMLLRQINSESHNDATEHLTFSTRLIVRHSTARCPA